MTITMRARYTGNREIAYRWVGPIGGGKICHAQDYPGAEIVGFDTFTTGEPDGRVTTSTKVRLPAGLLVLDSTKKGGAHEYAAGVLDGADAKNTITWSRARHIETKRVEQRKGPPAVVHVIEVDGVRSEYQEVTPSDM